MPAYVYTALYNFQCSLAHVILITIFLSQTGSFFVVVGFILFLLLNPYFIEEKVGAQRG